MLSKMIWSARTVGQSAGRRTSIFRASGLAPNLLQTVSSTASIDTGDRFNWIWPASVAERLEYFLQNALIALLLPSLI